MPIDSPPKREAASLAGSRLFLFLLGRLHLFETPHQKLPLLGRAVGSQDDVAFFEFLHDVTTLFVFLLRIYKFIVTHHSHYVPFFTCVENIAHAMKIGRIIVHNSTIFISIYVVSRRYFLASFNSPDFTTRDCYSDFLPILKRLGRNKVIGITAF